MRRRYVTPYYENATDTFEHEIAAKKQDQQFQQALRRAIENGAEKPPMTDAQWRSLILAMDAAVRNEQ